MTQFSSIWVRAATPGHAAALVEHQRDQHNLFINVRSYYFRGACSDHNAEHGRYLSWADARAMWRAAHVAARRYVCRETV